MDTTSSLDVFTHIGDVGRALAAAADKIQVQEVAVDEVAVIEEAAVLFANASDEAARSVLEESLDGAGAKSSDVVWRMLFDLYRLMGDQARFDARGVAYAQLFEKSPPVFDEGEATQPPASASSTESTPSVNLSGNLSGTARSQFEQLARIGAKTGKLRLDLSRLRGIDESGCTLLNETLATLKRSRVTVRILGAQHAFGLLEPRMKVGKAEGRDFWLLALTLMLYLDDQARFEDAAVNFAVTFEESPPSWEAVGVATVTDLTSSIVTPKVEVEAPPGFVLEGALGGAQPEVLRKLAAYASQRDVVHINARGLKRLEFVTAGALFNQLAQLQSQGRLSIIHEPNEMVAALLRVMGVDQVAQIEYKKF